MDMNWIESMLFGFFAGLADILPVSAKAHRMLFFSQEAEPAVLRLLVHIATVAALYYSCQNHILRITRAYKLSKIPKRRRKRPLDTASLLDLKMLRTMLIPVIFGFIFYDKLNGLITDLSLLPITLLINGVILFVPQFLPGSNKDSQTMTPLDSLLMGLAAVASLIPGISCIAVVTSIAIIRGADKGFALNISLLLSIFMTLGRILFDVIAIVDVGMSGLSFLVVLRFLIAAVAAFGGVFLGVKIMRKLASTIGFGPFAYYCWGAALFSFILFLSI